MNGAADEQWRRRSCSLVSINHIIIIIKKSLIGAQVPVQDPEGNSAGFCRFRSPEEFPPLKPPPTRINPPTSRTPATHKATWPPPFTASLYVPFSICTYCSLWKHIAAILEEKKVSSCNVSNLHIDVIIFML